MSFICYTKDGHEVPNYHPDQYSYVILTTNYRLIFSPRITVVLIARSEKLWWDTTNLLIDSVDLLLQLSRPGHVEGWM